MLLVRLSKGSLYLKKVPFLVRGLISNTLTEKPTEEDISALSSITKSLLEYEIPEPLEISLFDHSKRLNFRVEREIEEHTEREIEEHTERQTEEEGTVNILLSAWSDM
jgi:hypothetical protein